MRRIRLAAVVACAAAGLAGCGDPTATVTLHADSTFQTIVGWEAHAQSGETEIAQFPLYAQEVFDLAVDSLGINRLRVEAFSNIEHGRDLWTEWRRGELSDSTWRCVRFATEDDNGDPDVIDWSRFHFSQLDHTIEQVVLPIKRRLEARGEKLYLNVNYDAFALQCPNTPYHHLDDLDEYAEFALAVHLHLRGRYGLVPDGWEMILEPEHTHWRGRSIGEAMVRTARVLEAHGFRPDFIAPSTTSMGGSIEYFDEMMQVPGAAELLDEYSYHRYRARGADTARAIGERARRYGVRTAMLEHIGSGHEALWEDLVLAGNAAWQQFALAYGARPDGPDRGGVYFPVVLTDSAPPRVTWGRRTRFLRQYFHYVRAGAVRIGATSDAEGFDPVGFVHPDGRTVAVVNADRSARIQVLRLPAGTYGVSYATEDATVELDPVAIAAGDTLRTAIPARGVITVYARPEGP